MKRQEIRRLLTLFVFIHLYLHSYFKTLVFISFIAFNAKRNISKNDYK